MSLHSLIENSARHCAAALDFATDLLLELGSILSLIHLASLLLKIFSTRAEVAIREHFREDLSGSGCNSLYMLQHATSAKYINLIDEAQAQIYM